ncbi:B3 domain-containing transcription repressor VAL1-like isoform X2 [Ipomoea triloba]|uniref:B3 domain-containing transcription repressor VAL1-like isoform X2 n=1 Tax=Ipomoea triloba TaxID=35885 RepID=UPI00125D6D69|nr:B3 domain-containing transcription repressor VAL1-like isoform X2 [Ipomoea triloba]
MGSKFCMNELCRATTSSEWKKGWGLKSGGFATLCSNCGSAYEHLAFCDMFHMNDSGWRECRMCGKRIHCGCIASRYLYDYMDFGGIGCISCARRLGGHALRPIQTPNDDIPNGTLTMNKIGDTQRVDTENRMDENDFDKGRLLHLSRTMEAHKPGQLFQSQNNGKIKQEAAVPIREVACLPNLNQQSVETSIFGKTDINIPKQGVKDTYESINQTPMNFSLSTPVGTSSSALHILAGIVEGREQNKVSPFQQGQKAHHILPKPVKAAHSSGSEPKKGMTTPNRIARPPGEGRGGRNQLLPRYWPRITDQELQKLSGDLKSNIVPLFEKVLSASDAGRIGRLVLPKACAEAYFPAINHSEGIAIRVQDIKGQEWTFQFRFWPNNNSRMYVLEGVTPCIQSMQLQAGDTVTFSRIDPGGKLVMGFRKATNNADAQDSPNPTLPNGGSCTEIQVSGATDNDMNEIKAIDDPLPRPVSIPEKKKTRNIGSKNKRLLMQAKDALELKITWEEAQDLLRPPPSVKPTIVVIEEFEFEEYEEPPVFGKRTIFTARPSGEQDQWAQCDSCSKWRRLPMHALLPPKWTCLDNIWDANRCSCSAPDELSPKELDAFLRDNMDSKRRRITENGHDCEPSGLDALATVAVLGDNIGDLGEPSAGVGATTKHPRHRPGCSCIVCIQPPSGKGKHLPSCKCNVCLTVRRRFKTLMLRKKKKQSEREAELGGQGNEEPPRDGSEIEGASGLALIQMNHSENDSNPNGDNDPIEDAGTSKGQLDLNCDPNREEDMLALIPFDDPAANLPIETSRPVQNDLETLRDCLLAQAAREDEGNCADDTQIGSSDSKQENNRENGAQFLD